MTVSSAKSLSVELDIDAIKPIVSGLRSHGEAVLAGLKKWRGVSDSLGFI